MKFSSPHFPKQIPFYASENYLKRAEKLVEERCVRDVDFDGKYLRGTVWDEIENVVTVRIQSGGSIVKCTCLSNRTQKMFCEHGIAVIWTFAPHLKGRKNDLDASGLKTKSEESELHRLLSSMDKEYLIDRLEKQAHHNERLKYSLLMEASIHQDRLDVPVFEEAIKRTLHHDRMYDRRSVSEYVQTLEELTSWLRTLLERNHPEETQTLVECALTVLDGSTHGLEFSSYLGNTLKDLEQLYFDACSQSTPDVKYLASRLVHWEVKSEKQIFHQAFERYKNILGEEGCAEYLNIVRRQWKEYTTHGTHHTGGYIHQIVTRLSAILERNATTNDDIEALIAIKAKQLNSSTAYIEIAELALKANRRAEAIQWLEKGMNALRSDNPQNLRTYLLQLLKEDGQTKKVVELMWEEFEFRPSFEKYEQFKNCVYEMIGEKHWDKWRKKVIDFVHKTRNGRWEFRNYYFIYPVEENLLLQIFLHEDDIPAALEEAAETECSPDMWLYLAQVVEEKQPREALAIYQGMFENTVEMKTRIAYEKAVQHLLKVREMLVRLRKKDEWLQMISHLRAEHSSKKVLIGLMNEAGIENPVAGEKKSFRKGM